MVDQTTVSVGQWACAAATVLNCEPEAMAALLAGVTGEAAAAVAVLDFFVCLAGAMVAAAGAAGVAGAVWAMAREAVARLKPKARAKVRRAVRDDIFTIP